MLINYKNYWTKRHYSTPIADFFFSEKARSLVGGKLNFVLTGGAPVSEKTENLFKNIYNCPLLQGYGLTEVSGAIAHMTPTDHTIGSVGYPIPGSYIRLVNWEEGLFLQFLKLLILFVFKEDIVTLTNHFQEARL